MASTSTNLTTTTINGVKLHYVCKGNGPHAVLCIPGALGTVDHYAPQLDYFGREGSSYKVVAFDPRGFGESRDVCRSPNMEGLATEADAKDGYELMRSLGLTEFSVLGWCSGGRAALTLASMFPQSVQKLVVFGVRSYVTSSELQVYESKRDIDQWKPELRESLVNVYGADRLQMLWSQCIDTLSHCYTVNNGDICTQMLPKVTCPALIVHGGKDEDCPLFQAEYLRDHLINARLEVMELGKHSLHLKYNKDFNKLTDDFFKDTREAPLPMAQGAS